MNRRTFLLASTAPLLIGETRRAGLLAGESPLAPAAPDQAQPTLKPARLQRGDTIGLVAPASATFQLVEVDIARESVEGLGLKVKVGAQIMDRHGSLGGQHKDRAADINRFFAA